MPQDAEAPLWLLNLTLYLGVAGLGVWGYVFVRIVRGAEPISREPHRPVPWGADGAALAGLSLLLAAIMVVMDLIDAVDQEPAPLFTLQDAMGFALISATLALLAAWWQRQKVCARWTDFGLPTSVWQLARDTALGAGTFVAALAPVYAVQMLVVLILRFTTSHPAIEQLLASPDRETLFAMGLLAVVVAPLFEEFAFRVLLQGWLERVAGPGRMWPVVLSSFLFAAAHQGQGAAPVALFVLALFLGYLYRQTHRLAPCVVVHALFNGLTVAMVWGYATAS